MRAFIKTEMAGLNHNFLLVSHSEYGYVNISKLINHPDAIQIHDDLIRYMADSLLWIKSYNSHWKGLIPQKGLNFYGATIIKADGAATAARIFKSWADLFSNGEEQIKLTGSFVLSCSDDEDESPNLTVIAIDENSYEKFSINRDDTVGNFLRITEYCQKVLDSRDELYILHLGI